MLGFIDNLTRSYGKGIDDYRRNMKAASYLKTIKSYIGEPFAYIIEAAPKISDKVTSKTLRAQAKTKGNLKGTD